MKKQNLPRDNMKVSIKIILNMLNTLEFPNILGKKKHMMIKSRPLQEVP